MIRAIIDIGTNTAHILIADIQNRKVEEVLHKERHYTFLGEGGLETINDEAIERLKFALDEFAKALSIFNCKNVHIVATAGLRSASNGPIIQEQINLKYGWPISIISGLKESQYIYDGAKQAIAIDTGTSLIMDIGGGSVEYILSIDGEVIHQKSYPIGISRLYEQFHQNDPMTSKSVADMENHLDESLIGLWNAISVQTKEVTFIGCAGTFEIFLTEPSKSDIKVAYQKVDIKVADRLLSEVIDKGLDERTKVKGLPKERMKYIVVALLLINYMTQRLDSKHFIVCKYALKEGAIIDETLFLD